jgi:8-oxo-dGTP pyrophosphatase MutT (NUDIX family)
VFTAKENGVLSFKDRIVCSGALFYSKSTRKVLLLQKARGKHQGTWGLVGGTNENQETPWEGLQREIQEEIGSIPSILKTIPLETFVTDDRVFQFHTYLCVVEKEFLPSISSEHIGYSWCSIENTPKPLHQGLKNSFTNRITKAKLQTIFNVLNYI